MREFDRGLEVRDCIDATLNIDKDSGGSSTSFVVIVRKIPIVTNARI